MVATFLLFLWVAFGSDPAANTTKTKIVESKRRVSTITVDGVIAPGEWKDATFLHSFVELRPTPGKPEAETSRTEAYLVYDDEGIYFGGTAFESNKNEISSELIGRDGFGNNDFIGLVLDTYKDNLNAFEYFITPLNEQMDARVAPNMNGNSEDFSWNAVWESAVTIHENGWSFELFIPLASIRFSPQTTQDWGLNIVRRRQKSGQQLFWNPIDPNVNGFLTQEGYLTGITGIKPPVRLQLSPYLSFYGNHYPYNTTGINNLSTQLNGGMDLKWGINQAFTLDATLIPDFGQVQSDPQVFNLSPFEVRFNENRAFFTEGTELFNRGGLFYSRRIGGFPVNYGNAENQRNENEVVVSNPSETKLLNASKLSGRTRGGLGIGVLNAVTNPSYAVLEDSVTGLQRDVQTSPFTNYNVLVFNQSLKYNSSVSFVNTSVLRAGDAFNTNVGAVMFDLNDKTNTWNVGGQFNGSARYNDVNGRNENGYSHGIYAGKTSGTIRYNIWQELADKKYNANDLGYFTNANYITQGIWFSVNRPKPYRWRNNMQTNFNLNYSRLFAPFWDGGPVYQNARLNMNSWAQTKKLHWLGFVSDISPYANDFYEARAENRYFRRGGSAMAGMWFESNTNKAFSINPELYIRRFFDFYDATSIDANLAGNWRANTRFSMRLGVFGQLRFNNVGFSSFENGEPIFAKREVRTIETSLRSKYSFTNRMFVTFVGRHYVSAVNNNRLYSLESNGSLSANSMNPVNNNRTLNFFNIDMVYTWQIAQGSFVNIVWKSAIFRGIDNADFHYVNNFRNTLLENQNNSVSFRMIYFLDYATMRKSGRRAA
jgi:hypothetical protein